jgi:hypothetical protein
MINRNIKMVGQYFGDGFIMIIFKPAFDRIDRIFLDIYFLAPRKVMKTKDNPDNPVKGTLKIRIQFLNPNVAKA